jgi:hypothetical protein
MSMKIIINESRLESLAKRYIKKNLGKYALTDNLTNFDGFFYNGREITGKTSGKYLHIIDPLFDTCQSMFNIPSSELIRIFLEVAEDITEGRKFKSLYLEDG